MSGHPQAPTIKHPSNIKHICSQISNYFETKFGIAFDVKKNEQLTKMALFHAEQVISANPTSTMSEINSQIVKLTANSFKQAVEKKSGPLTTLSLPLKNSAPAPTPASTVTRKQLPSVATTGGVSITGDFERVQAARREETTVLPADVMPTFQQIDDRVGPDAMSNYNKIKKDREEQTHGFASALGVFAAATESASNATSVATAARAAAATTVTRPTTMEPPPDRPLEFLFGKREIQTNTQPVAPTGVPEIIRQQHFLAPPIPTLAANVPIGPHYCEVEQNLFVSSLDRDWYRSSDTRYRFTVLFDAANGTRNASETTNSRAKNAVNCDETGIDCLRNDVPTRPVNANVLHRFNDVIRLELIKLTIPNEAVDTVITQTVPLDASGNTSTIVKYMNALSFPHLNLQLAPYSAENFASNQSSTTAFGVVTYDATANPDTTVYNRGWLSMLPKYLHCQRIFDPILATLQTLVFEIDRPNGDRLSTIPDVFDIDSIAFGQDISGGVLGPSLSSFTGTDPSGQPMYIYVVTNNYFPASAIVPGDTVIFQGYDIPSATGLETPITSELQTEFNTWMNDLSGHYVVGTASHDASDNVIDTPNAAGYVNMFVIRNRFADPTTGSVLRQLWGGTADIENDLRVLVKKSLDLDSTICKAINANRQIDVVFKVFVRRPNPGALIVPST